MNPLDNFIQSLGPRAPKISRREAFVAARDNFSATHKKLLVMFETMYQIEQEASDEAVVEFGAHYNLMRAANTLPIELQLAFDSHASAHSKSIEALNQLAIELSTLKALIAVIIVGIDQLDELERMEKEARVQATELTR